MINHITLQTVIDFRKQLHQNPELSGEETETAKMVSTFFEPLAPDQVITNLGGTGIAFVFEGKENGPASLFRCELDGLPIQEKNDLEYISSKPGKSHVCGHDGHMAIVSGLGMYLSKNKPEKGKVILLFQPAEETGEGAMAILQDPQFDSLRTDFAFALHNLPGFEKNQILIKNGAFSAASMGMVIKLHGRNSHSAHPEAGNSPAEAMCKIIVALEKLPDAMKKFTLITVIHAELGKIAFGTTPGEATIRATIRAFDNETRDLISIYAEKSVSQIANQHQLGFEISYTEIFAASINHPEAWHYGNEAAKILNLNIKHVQIPFRWSEDFGLFSRYTKTLLFGLGSGKSQRQLHEPDFDFPDEIIPTGINMFTEIIRQIHS